MVIRRRTKALDAQSFHKDLSKCQDVDDIDKAVQHAVCLRCHPAYKGQFMIDGMPGFCETKGSGSIVSVPLLDEYTIVLLNGSFQLDDEDEDTVETCVGLETHGSKTLKVRSNSIAVWLPSICCWNTSECWLARNGQCRRVPGVIVGGDPKKPKMSWKAKRMWEWSSRWLSRSRWPGSSS